MATVMRPEDVRSRTDLATFLAELSDEVHAGRLRVENATSGDLLEAAGGWIRDLDGFFRNRGEEVPSEPSWQLVARIFAASLVYE